MQTQIPKLYTVRHAAELLCLTSSGLRKMVAQGRITASHVYDGVHGTSLIFEEQVLLAALDERATRMRESSPELAQRIAENAAILRGQPMPKVRRPKKT